MLKQALSVSVLALIALATTAFAQSSSSSSSSSSLPQTIALEVIYRDYPVVMKSGSSTTQDSSKTAAGFEERDSQKGNNRQCSSTTGATTGMVADDLYYDKAFCDANEDWKMEDEEAVDKGFPERDHIVYRYCARPKEGNGKCYSAGNIERWFSDDGVMAKDGKTIIPSKRINGDSIVFNLQSDGTYLVQYDKDRGGNFFPLNKYHGQKDVNGEDLTWGRQNSSSQNGPSCVPSNTTSNCHNFHYSVAGAATFVFKKDANDIFEFLGDDDMWIFIDGKLVVDLGGVHGQVAGSIDINDLASAEGWTEGSVHSLNFFYMERQTVEANLKIKMSLNGFVGDRKPRDKDMRAPRIIGAKTEYGSDGTGTAITDLFVSIELDVDDINEKFINPTTPIYPIIVKLAEDNSICGYRLESISKGFYKQSEWLYEITGKVVCYDKNGAPIERDLASGDSLSFNVTLDQALFPPDKCANDKPCGTYDNERFALADSTLAVKAKNKKLADAIEMAPNTSSLQWAPFKPTIPDTDPWKPPFPTELFGGGASGSGAVGYIPSGKAPGLNSFNSQGAESGGKVNSFGTVGNILPSNRTGELILTAYPSAGAPGSASNWKEVVEDKFFGLPPSANKDNGLYGIADPSKQNQVDGAGTTGGYPFVKNGFSGSPTNEGSVNGTMQLAPTRCVSLIKGEEAKINCLNFNFPVHQPFQLSVIVYDQIGNFVTQYREVVTEQEFRYITQGPNYIPDVAKDLAALPTDVNCKKPGPNNYGDKDVMTSNGQVNVGVNIYPFSQNGRKFGNGVYILKVDLVELPFDGCYNTGEKAENLHSDFRRSHTDMKFGWMRSCNDCGKPGKASILEENTLQKRVKKR